MTSSVRACAPVALLALAFAGCSAGPAAPAGSAPATASAPATSPSASASVASSPAGSAATATLSTKSPDCAAISRPKELKRTGAATPVMCAYESATDYVSFAVSDFARSFDQAAEVENAKIEQLPVEGWSFAAQWPADGKFLRVQRWLVDAKGMVLLCKMGSDRGEKGIAELAAVCEAARAKLSQQD